MKQENFNRCQFNPMDKDFPTKAKRLMDVCDNVPLMKYVVCMYDPNSPMRDSYPELGQRKEESGRIASYMPEEEMSVLEVFAAFEYLKIVNNRIWASIVGMEQAVWEYNKMLLEPMQKSEAGTSARDRQAALQFKQELANNVMELNTKLSGLIDAFYGDRQLQAAAEDAFVSYTPEKMAEILSNNGYV